MVFWPMCTQISKNPPPPPCWIELCEFLQVFYAESQQGNGEPYNITDGDFVVGTSRNVPSILGFEIIFREDYKSLDFVLNIISNPAR